MKFMLQFCYHRGGEDYGFERVCESNHGLSNGKHYGSSVLEILFEYYDTQRRIDSDEIRARYNKLYEQINHRPIKEITEIEMPMYWLISEYEARGFKEGVKVGLILSEELN